LVFGSKKWTNSSVLAAHEDFKSFFAKIFDFEEVVRRDPRSVQVETFAKREEE